MPQICIYLLGRWEKSEIRIIPKLCPPLSPPASESGGGSCPPRSYGGAAHECMSQYINFWLYMAYIYLKYMTWHCTGFDIYCLTELDKSAVFWNIVNLQTMRVPSRVENKFRFSLAVHAACHSIHHHSQIQSCQVSHNLVVSICSSALNWRRDATSLSSGADKIANCSRQASVQAT